MTDDVEGARVPDERAHTHGTLFALSDYATPPLSPADVCRRVGMNWFAAQRLRECGWLSFDPKTVSHLTASQEAELNFLGTLVAAGCDEIMLPRLLKGLRKPYAYRIDRMHYSWQEKSWRMLPADSDLRERFDTWVDTLEESAQLEKLEDLGERVDHAIRDVRSWRGW